MNATTNSTTTVTPDVPVQLPPALTAYIDGIRPAMYILLFCAVWLGIAIPLLVILFYTSSKTLRRTAVFVSNVIGISLAIALGVLNVVIETNGILDPLAGLNRKEVVAYTFLSSVVSSFVDCILFFRVAVVYPRNTTSKRIWFGIMVPLVLIKFARFVNVVVFMCQFVSKTNGLPQAISQFEPTVRKLIGETIEWSLQLVDNTICSSLFLWALRKSGKVSQMDSISSGMSSKYSYHKAIGTLFWIATTNMVFPCLFDVVLLVLFFRDPDGTHYLVVLISNNYIQLIGVLFATVWGATRQQNLAKDQVARPPRDMSIQFARNAGLKNKKRVGELESGIEMTESVNIDFGSSSLESSVAASGLKESGINGGESII